jgi:hypothetical protein
VSALKEFGLISQIHQQAAMPLWAPWPNMAPGILVSSPVGIHLVSAGEDVF